MPPRTRRPADETQADAFGLLGRDDAPGVEQLFCLWQPDQQRQRPGGVDPAIARRQKTKRGTLAADSEVERRAHQCRTAIGEPVDGTDQRLGKGGDVPGGVSADLLAGRQFLGAEPSHLVDVGAGGKRPFARTGQDYRLDAFIGFVVGQRLVELAHQREAQRIELVGAVQRDHGNPVETLGQNEFMGHASVSFAAPRRLTLRGREC
jgi:hypothetical protein